MEISSEERVSLLINFLVSLGMKEQFIANPLAFHDVMKNLFGFEYEVDYNYGLIDNEITLFTVVNGIGYTIQGPIFFIEKEEQLVEGTPTGSFSPVKAEA